MLFYVSIAQYVVLLYLLCFVFLCFLLFFFFFFQAEDGIRDGHVTGVQTCALPISACSRNAGRRPRSSRRACSRPSCRRSAGSSCTGATGGAARGTRWAETSTTPSTRATGAGPW